jgi:uncharacterized protein YjbJ (UPF0337 family)
MWNKDEVEGKGKDIKGKVKEKVGEWTNDPDLEAEGNADQVEGNVQETFGETKRKVGETIEEIGKKVGK